jgi:TIR domain/SIR2-like domain
MAMERKSIRDSPDLPPVHPRVWDIVDAIEREDESEGVIPIVGQDLLVVQSRFNAAKARASARTPEIFESVCKVLKSVTEPVLLTDLLARVMSARLHLQESKEILSRAVAQHPEINSNRYLVDTELKEIYLTLDIETPLPLQELASIRKLNLFVTTTADDLMERALNDVRFDGESLTRVLSFAPGALPSDQKIAEALESGYPVVFHLFGRYKSPGHVASIESDYVDFIAALLNPDTRPRRLFAELKGKHLLLLGNSFQDWLARFFLRLTKDTPFVDPSGCVQYVADAEVQRNRGFVFFLKHCAKKATPIEEIDPGTFISQVAASYAQKEIQMQKGGKAAAATANTVGSDCIFISYARSDLGGRTSPDVDRCKRLVNDLRKEGFKVWLDLSGGLRGGDDYAKEVKNAINRCGLFLPICSRTTQMRPDAANEEERPFFRREWSWALERSAKIQQEEPDRKFVIPVVVDDLPFAASNVPSEFKKLHASELCDGAATQDFISELRNMVRSIKRKEFVGV